MIIGEPETAQIEESLRALERRLGYTQQPPGEIVNELGYQLLRMKELDRSLEAFRFNTNLYPRSANVWDSLADALEEAGKKDEALASCRKAISLAEANRDSNLERLRKHFDRLANATKPDLKSPPASTGSTFLCACKLH